MDMDIL